MASAHLIDDKISFLKNYPAISHDRAKAFNYTQLTCDPSNISGLEKRISLLLGYPDLSFTFSISGNNTDPYTVKFSLDDNNEKVWLNGSIKVKATNEVLAKEEAFKDIINLMIQTDAYEIKEKGSKYLLRLKNDDGDIVGSWPENIDNKPAAQDLMNELLGWSANEKAFVVEHLLLRPKFPGDALFPACSDGPCKTCGDEDPYSFRLTYVMPGWTSPFNINLDMRRFADRTIRYELPSHLLGKICWVGNDGFIENPCDPVISQLTNLLVNKALTEGGTHPSEEEACACALSIYSAFAQAFSNWYENKTLDYLHADALDMLLEKAFSTLKPADISCSATIDKPLWAEITDIMILYFKDIALYGWQFERFENAWCQWLAENATFDWTEERLHDHVEAILKANLETETLTGKYNLCECAANLVNEYGAAFYKWISRNLEAGRDFKDFTRFTTPKLTLCPNIPFKDETLKQVTDFLSKRYRSYRKVSYLLWKVVHLLSKLRNTYPGATLHDCDDGSDQNPVRLGSTALGNYPMKRNISL